MRMLGYKTRKCPYGRSCSCNEAPGKATTKARRNVKRRERQQWRREIAKD